MGKQIKLNENRKNMKENFKLALLRIAIAFLLFELFIGEILRIFVDILFEAETSRMVIRGVICAIAFVVSLFLLKVHKQHRLKLDYKKGKRRLILVCIGLIVAELIVSFLSRYFALYLSAYLIVTIATILTFVVDFLCCKHKK